MKLVLFLILISLGSFYTFEAFAEPIKITQSFFSDDLIFDGKWTHEYEWKPTSWNHISDSTSTLNIRTAHQEEFIYVLLDYVVLDNKKHQNDYAIFCIDGDNAKLEGITGDEFCFKLFMNSNEPETYLLETKNNSVIKKIIENHDDLIAISDLSDENDRYSKIPHPTYEFRIPIELFGRSNNYGVFISIYDAENNKTLIWPSDIKNSEEISSPKIWGDMFSPDNSLPEFPFPLFIIIIILSVSIIFGKLKNLQIKV